MSANGTRRINRGRSHSYILDGDKADSITWAINAGVPKPGLIPWSGEKVTDYAIDHWEDLCELKPSERRKLLLAAPNEARNAAALRGTIVHGLAQRLYEHPDVDVEVPDEYRDHVDAYLRFVDEWRPRELLVERPVFSRRWRYAGTPDLIAELADGLVWLLDWKTAASGVWPEMALQLAAARYADFYLDDEGLEQPVPPVDATGIVWLRADGYDLIPVAADEQAYRVFLHALHVARFAQEAKDQRDQWVGDALPALEVRP